MRKALAVIRWIMAAFLASFAIRNITLATPPLLLVASLLICPETAMPFAEFCGRCWAGLFYPEDRLNKPPLSYTLADFYCKNHRHEETVREHLGIIRHYPDQRKSYLEVIAHCRAIGATKMANQYERRFRKRFKIVDP